MVKTIVQREVLEYFKSSKFLLGLCLTMVLVVISTFINIGDYQQRQQDYLDAQKDLKEDSFRLDLFRKPQALSILAQGKDRELGNRITVNYLDIPMQTSGYMGGASQHHRYVSGFASVDFAFIVRVVLSLLVIFLTYNSIAEERIQGTLKLVLSNNLPRGQLLLGKFLGGLLVIVCTLTMALLVAVLIMVRHPAVSLDRDAFLCVLGMGGISLLYLLVFYTLSLWLSTRVNHPAMALLILLQVWIVVIVITPNMSVLLSQQVTTLPNTAELEDRKRAQFEPFAREHRETREAFHKMVRSGERDQALQLKNVQINAKRTEMFHQVNKSFSQEQTRQMQLAQTLAIFSPAVLFDIVMQRLAHTDIHEFDAFMAGVERHWHKYVERSELRYTDYEASKGVKLPLFSYTRQSFPQCLANTLIQWIVLFLLSVLLFTAAHTVFVRKDVG